jgi:toxin-antitoxin system PIN domain toxin
MPIGDASFVDANILVYAAMEESPQHADSRHLLESGQSLRVSPQVLIEFYSVVTNARRVSTPFKPAEAVRFIEQLGSRVEVISIDPVVVQTWTKLAVERAVMGADVFDLQIVATLTAHGIRRIYTYNQQDFAGFSDLVAITPPSAK